MNASAASSINETSTTDTRDSPDLGPQRVFTNLDGTDEIDTGKAHPVEHEAKIDDPLILLSKFTLYETKQAFFIVGSNARETRFRVLRIPLVEMGVDEETLEFIEDQGVLSRDEVMELLDSIETTAKSEGDTLSKRLTAWGILGFMKFTERYYICFVTRCSAVALLGGHFIFHIDETKLVPIVHSSLWRKPDRRSREARLAYIFHSLDLTKTFYFSPSYDITQTLQTNLTRERQAENGVRMAASSREEMFVWNVHLLKPMLERCPTTMEWCLSVIHGFIDQAKISVFGNPVFITLIARRSHYFAGARFFKRGVNNQGHVANEVETEQIVSRQLISSFHDSRGGSFNSSRYTSYVQHRGSICLQWSQDTNNISPKPPIRLDNVDPYFAAGARHFDDMLDRYGSPILVFNLVKQKEHTPRESLLSKEFEHCIRYLNQFLPQGKRIHYTAWDMSRAAKSKSSGEVIEYLEKYAKDTLKETGFFHNGHTMDETALQQGICRTNCIDCLDRTNAAQSVIGKCALGQQLHAIGVIDTPEVSYDTDAVDLLTEMYHDHGDTLALQYGGSNLVNSVETYRKINQWTSHSRDLIESIRRFYTNSFVDAQRQDAINLFLGHYQYNKETGFNLWDLSTDYYLHNLPTLMDGAITSYTEWYTPVNLMTIRERIKKGLAHHEIKENALGPLPGFQLQFEPYWNRLYRPRVLTSLENLFVMRMNSTDRYKHSKNVPTSPFEVHIKKKTRKLRRDQSPHPSNKETHFQLLPADVPAAQDDTQLFYEKYANLDTSEPDSALYEKYFEEPQVDESEYEKDYDDDWDGTNPLKWPIRPAFDFNTIEV